MNHDVQNAGSLPDAPAAKPRTCGSCQMCCWLFCVPEMDKARHENCKHQGEHGCTIHDQPRPDICTDFLCAWYQQPWWPEEMRPDRSGVIFSMVTLLTRSGGVDRYIYRASCRSPYTKYTQPVLKWSKKLVGQGHVILFATRCEENPAKDDVSVSLDQKRYPALRPEQVVEIVRAASHEALAKQAAWEAAHR
jgi:hypothetical protein